MTMLHFIDVTTGQADKTFTARPTFSRSQNVWGEPDATELRVAGFHGDSIGGGFPKSLWGCQTERQKLQFERFVLVDDTAYWRLFV